MLFKTYLLALSTTASIHSVLASSGSQPLERGIVDTVASAELAVCIKLYLAMYTPDYCAVQGFSGYPVAT